MPPRLGSSKPGSTGRSALRRLRRRSRREAVAAIAGHRRGQHDADDAGDEVRGAGEANAKLGIDARDPLAGLELGERQQGVRT